jgi:hypothetical protein
MFNSMCTMRFNIIIFIYLLFFKLNRKTKSHPNAFNPVVLYNTGDVNLVKKNSTVK